MSSWEGIARRLWSPQPRTAHAYELVSTDSERSLDLPSPSSRRGSPTLPTSRHPFRRHGRSLRSLLLTCLHLITLRRVVVFILSIPVLLAVGILWSGIPPSFDNIREYERRLPQHNTSLPYPEGENGMYLRFPGHIWGHGLNNVLQEIILMSHLAYLANRSYVFEEYTWSHTPLPWTIYDFALRPARIPLNAFISGPSAGGPMSSPRAVSAEYYQVVCPKDKRITISSKDAPSDADGDKLLEWWTKRLADTAEGCVEVENDPPVFNWFLFGSERVLATWPSLSQSPIIQDYAWSPLVASGVTRNFALLHAHSAKDTISPSPRMPSLSDPYSSQLTRAPGTRDEVINGLVAVHLRRGDYIRHCPRLAQWGATYMGFNQFPSLPDKFEPPSFSHLKNLDGRSDYYMQHCWPSNEQIVEKLRAVREEHQGLKRVYILTNGWGYWVNELRDELRRDGWEEAKSSLDVRLDNEQKYVSMAVDMAIAERAEVFVGNGFSSLSSNIVMLRMAKEMDPRSNRFW